VNCEKNIATKENVLFNHFERNKEEKTEFLKRVTSNQDEMVDVEAEVIKLKMEAEVAKSEGNVKDYYDKWEEIVKLNPAPKHRAKLKEAKELLES
jgi:hypothetical protein